MLAQRLIIELYADPLVGLIVQSVEQHHQISPRLVARQLVLLYLEQLIRDEALVSVLGVPELRNLSLHVLDLELTRLGELVGVFGAMLKLARLKLSALGAHVAERAQTRLVVDARPHVEQVLLVLVAHVTRVVAPPLTRLTYLVEQTLVLVLEHFYFVNVDEPNNINKII